MLKCKLAGAGAKMLKCKNTTYAHECHPAYARKYNGYCLDCANAGVAEMQTELDAKVAVLAERDAEIAQLNAEIAENVDWKCQHSEYIAIASENAKRLLEDNARLLASKDAEIDRMKLECIIMAKLAADEPAFDNPLLIYAAKDLRDKILRSTEPAR